MHLPTMNTRFGWGEAVTPALADDVLIVNRDQEENSFIVALDAKTGEERWRKAAARHWQNVRLTAGRQRKSLLRGQSRNHHRDQR